MYDLIYQIIGHVWDSSAGSSSTEQQLLMHASIAIIIIFSVWILDRISVFIISCAKGGK